MTIRMSGALANNIATKMLAKKKSEIDKLQKNLEIWTFKKYWNSIPKVVLNAFKKHPAYIHFYRAANHHDSIVITATGFAGRKYFQVIKNVPYRWNNNECHLTGEDAAYFVSANDLIQTLTKKYREAHDGIVVALMALKTFARIQSEFPEAVKYLPKSTSTALMVDMNKLREQIKEII